ncbi:hypothetical protein ACFLYB_04830 [Chloroflexota bacterium]
MSVVAIIGGIYTVQRKNWGLALTEAFCAIVPMQILGILSIVFIALSKKEFE